jgi:molecular chaperone GrpE
MSSKSPKTSSPPEDAGAPEAHRVTPHDAVSSSGGDRSGGASDGIPADQGGGEGEVVPADAIEIEVEPPEPGPEQRISELEARVKDTHDKYLRSVAELDNVRKRARKDQEEARIDAQSRVLREMLPVIDNLERAVAHAAQSGDGASGLLEGIRLVLRQFAQALERCNVHPVEARGQPFDPNQHEAVSQMVTADAPPGSVVEVMQTGYRIGERLLRPALVVVAKAPPAAESEPAGPNGRDPSAES